MSKILSLLLYKKDFVLTIKKKSASLEKLSKSWCESRISNKPEMISYLVRPNSRAHNAVQVQLCVLFVCLN